MMYDRGGVIPPAPSLAFIHPRERLITRAQIARAFGVPLIDLDPDRLRAELRLRATEPDRWADDGGVA